MKGCLFRYIALISTRLHENIGFKAIRIHDIFTTLRMMKYPFSLLVISYSLLSTQ